VLASHNGVYSFAIGQRKGLGVIAKNPQFVKDIDAKSKKVVISEFEGLLKESFMIKDINYCSIDPLQEGDSMDTTVVVRNRMAPQNCTLLQKEGFAEVRMKDRPIWAVASGQIASFYSDDVLLASGFIL
jgi:tRNA-specific 2-thiouridylase